MMSQEDAKDLVSGIKGFDTSSLRPTTTTVRGLPVVNMESWWGDKAVTAEDGKKEDKDVPETDPSPAAVAGAGAGESSVTVTIADDAEAPEAVHGWRYNDAGWDPAPRVVSCEKEARPGYATKKAHEYEETAETFKAKIKALADLIRESTNTVAYAGAGLSTASGVADYASKASSTKALGSGRPKLRSPLEARPTKAHHVLTALAKTDHPTAGGQKLLTYLLQQNHDGLPEKAGFPVERVNEIHGSWWNPTNPVVPMSGSLRTDLFEDLLAWEEKAGLCLALGTSLCGMNADRVAVSCAERALAGVGGGLVIVSLQATQYDHMATLRIFGKLDDVFMALAGELGLKDRVTTAVRRPHDYRLPAGLTTTEDVFTVPYSRRTGKLDPSGRTIVVDLREGQKVRIVSGPYEGDVGEVLNKNRDGHYRILFQHKRKGKGGGTRPMPVQRLLGSWNMEAAVKGSLSEVPVVNA